MPALPQLRPYPDQSAGRVQDEADEDEAEPKQPIRRPDRKQLADDKVETARRGARGQPPRARPPRACIARSDTPGTWRAVDSLGSPLARVRTASARRAEARTARRTRSRRPKRR